MTSDFGQCFVKGGVVYYVMQNAEHAEELANLLHQAAVPRGTSTRWDKGWQQDSDDLFAAAEFVKATNEHG